MTTKIVLQFVSLIQSGLQKDMLKYDAQLIMKTCFQDVHLEPK